MDIDQLETAMQEAQTAEMSRADVQAVLDDLAAHLGLDALELDDEGLALFVVDGELPLTLAHMPGIPGVVVDGNDVLAVYEAAQEAVARARKGEGPTLIECKTYRWRAHTERPGAYDPRPEEEIAAWKAKDPIARLVEQLKQQQGQFSEAEFQAMDDEVQAAIQTAVAFAEASPFPAPEAALDDVFAD